jgi:hypothetical protein
MTWVCVALLASAFGCACSGSAFGWPFAIQACTASSDDVELYLHRVTALVSRQMRSDMLGRNEEVRVSFALDDDGSATDLLLVRARRPMTGAEAVRAVRAAAPFPAPPFDPDACLEGGRAEISLVSYGRCDRDLAERYVQAAARRVQDAIRAAALTAPRSERIALRLQIDAQGAARSVRVQSAESAEAGERAAELADSLSYEVPGESIRECIADRPFSVWVEVP